MVHKEEIANLLLEKLVSEEIMTKSEFQLSLDKIMDKHTAAMTSKFQTKEEFQLSIDRIMDRHEVKFDARFQLFDDKLQVFGTEIKGLESRMDRQFLKIDARYNWIIGVAITATISIVGTMLKFMTMLQH